MLKKKMENIFTNFEYSKLEFDKILNEISKYALSQKGMELIQAINPYNDFEKIKLIHETIIQLKDYFVTQEQLEVSSIYNFEKSVEDSIKNITIDSLGLYKLSYSTNVYFSLYKKLNKPQYPKLKALFTIDKLENNFYIEILKFFKPDGYIESGISQELKVIRKNIIDIELKIKKATESFLHEAKDSNYTIDDIVTIRDGFSCIAIKSQYKNKVNGIILDSSGTGQTAYVVPHRVLELHNDLVMMHDEEKKEIYRILQEFTSIIKENAIELKIINEELIEFDIFYSKAKFALTGDYNSPEIVTQKNIKIIDGKHPIIGEKAIPLNIEIGTDYKMLIISGPNTGGKTVVLKTIGLFSLMVQSGIQISASPSSQFCIFDKIFLDIGDEQSIEQSLSTFSAHIKKIITILNDSNDKSLILLDEFCAGTDPTEGAALAVAIIQKLLSGQSISLITTHYSALKHFASQHDMIQNASMEFDAVNLSPTYKLLLGISGSSKAFEISKRLGMPDEIIDEAKSNLSKDFIDLEKLTAKLEHDKKELEFQKEELESKQKELNNNVEFYNSKINEIKIKEKELKGILKTKESSFLREARAEFEELIKSIKHNNASKESIVSGKVFFKQKDEILSLEEKENEKTKDILFKKGDNVLVISKNMKGTILDKSNEKDKYIVQLGIIKLTTHVNDLNHIKGNGRQDNNINYSFADNASNKQVVLDLRGQRFEKAEKLMDKFIEEAIRNNVSQVRIIHGKGTGVLKKCIHDYCDASPFIVDYFYEKSITEDATNFGVTIVVLKK